MPIILAIAIPIKLPTIPDRTGIQLDMAKAETVAAKKEALISKIIAIVSLIVSVAIGVVQIFL